MADFCKPCSTYMFGEDLDGIRADAGCTLTFLCEGCGGYITVDEAGNKAAETEAEKHLNAELFPKEEEHG